MWSEVGEYLGVWVRASEGCLLLYQSLYYRMIVVRALRSMCATIPTYYSASTAACEFGGTRLH